MIIRWSSLKISQCAMELRKCDKNDRTLSLFLDLVKQILFLNVLKSTFWISLNPVFDSSKFPRNKGRMCTN